MINTAVILAAGLGSRLGDKVKEKPKGFLEIEGKAIIEISIDKLIEAGIKNIIIGTGYLACEYEKLMLKYPEIKCVLNDKYESTGSLYTLYNLRNSVLEDFILLESDIIYEKQGLNILINENKSDVILASSFTNSHDEVFIETNEESYLVNMSKKRENLNSSNCELVGITKISYETFKQICSYAEKALRDNEKLDYEYALVAVSKAVEVFVKKVEGFKWCEIDDESHYFRAINYIYPKIKEQELLDKLPKRKVLLNPGPATTTNTVKLAQVVEDICPREKEFGEVMEFVSTELTKLVADPNEYVTVLFGGSGTAAVEAILSSVVEKEALLIINNGAYGKRMCEIAKVYGLDYIEFKSSEYEQVDFNKLENTIKSSDRKISHLAVIHNETTTGLLNDIERIGALSKQFGIKLIVDAMSSFAAVPIDMKRMNISYLASSSNKNIQGMAGVSFVIASKNDLESIKSIKPRNLYLNLYSQYKYFINNYQMRFTPPVQTIYALKRAIVEAKEEGIENRYKRYSKSWETLIKGVTKLGLKTLVKEEDHSKIITTIVEPNCENYSFDAMHDYLYENGFTIYPGKVSDLNTFRIANIGVIDYRDIERFIALLGEYLQRIGYVK